MHARHSIPPIFPCPEDFIGTVRTLYGLGVALFVAIYDVLFSAHHDACMNTNMNIEHVTNSPTLPTVQYIHKQTKASKYTHTDNKERKSTVVTNKSSTVL
jgi:capsular polysaccharide biosynthesis protein